MISATSILVSELLGRKFYTFKNDNGVSKIIHENGFYSDDEIKNYLKFLGAGDYFIDVGTNIGAVSFSMATLNSRIKVIGFEPIKYYYDLAAQNLWPLQNVQIYNYAVGAAPALSSAPVINDAVIGNYGAISLKIQTGRSLPIVMIQLDAFLAALNVKPSVIKIDVEGMEAEVLKGCDGLVDDDLIIAFECDRREAALRALTEAHRRFKYVVACKFKVLEGVGSIMMFASNDAKIVGTLTNGIQLMQAHDYDKAMEHLKITPRL